LHPEHFSDGHTISHSEAKVIVVDVVVTVLRLLLYYCTEGIYVYINSANVKVTGAGMAQSV
jgi:hypothetical protein